MTMRSIALAAFLVTLATTPGLAAEPETRACIVNRTIKATRFSPEQGYFVRSGARWFQNRANGCPLFAEGRSVQATGTLGQQCNGDQVTLVQPITDLTFGTCILGEWTEVDERAVPKR
jgi:hypothetical protein